MATPNQLLTALPAPSGSMGAFGTEQGEDDPVWQGRASWKRQNNQPSKEK